MKKLIDFILLTSLFIINGCSNTAENATPSPYNELNNLEGVTLLADKQTVSPSGLILLIKNETANEYTFGEAYVLEQKIDADWYQMPVGTEEDYGFIDIGYILDPNETVKRVIDWEWLYEPLDAGEYRIVIDILDVHKAGDLDIYPMSAEFTI